MRRSLSASSPASLTRALIAASAALALAFACQVGTVSEDGNVPGTGGDAHSGGRGTGGGAATGGSAVTGGRTGSTGGNGTTGGATGTGGALGATGGNRPADAGVPTGGANTGGARTGGNASGGNNTGGATGGNRATGGTSTGGTSTGGTSTGGSPATGGAGNATQPPPITNGQSGYSTRYWDCCKPACGWKNAVSKGTPAVACNMSNQSLGGNYDEQSVCSGGGAYTCWNEAPWALSDTLSYGYAAVHGSAFRCGQCYQLQFDGRGKYNASDAGSATLKGKTMIVQVLNTGSDVSQGQFDLLIPGGGVGQFPQGCQKQFPGANLGATSGGMLATCGGAGANAKSCVLSACQSAFSGKADMLAGCQWFGNWFGTADDPTFLYQEVACPAALTQRSGLSDPG